MGDGDLKTSLEVSSFLNDQIPESWGNLYQAGKLPNGAHFIIEKDGRVICLTPPVSSDESRISYDRGNHKWLVRRHQDGNPIALGIENITDQGNLTDLTKEQIESNAKLARWLLWMENRKIDYAMSHHQFNDDQNYDLFLTAFKLHHLQKQYRTKGRKDIGDKNLRRIIDKIKQYEYTIHSFFDLN
jgi:N-acetyl-anhydromuramyl-L-alanine amidase AmpD